MDRTCLTSSPLQCSHLRMELIDNIATSNANRTPTTEIQAVRAALERANNSDAKVLRSRCCWRIWLQVIFVKAMNANGSVVALLAEPHKRIKRLIDPLADQGCGTSAWVKAVIIQSSKLPYRQWPSEIQYDVPPRASHLWRKSFTSLSQSTQHLLLAHDFVLSHPHSKPCIHKRKRLRQSSRGRPDLDNVLHCSQYWT